MKMVPKRSTRSSTTAVAETSQTRSSQANAKVTKTELKTEEPASTNGTPGALPTKTKSENKTIAPGGSNSAVMKEPKSEVKQEAQPEAEPKNKLKVEASSSKQAAALLSATDSDSEDESNIALQGQSKAAQIVFNQRQLDEKLRPIMIAMASEDITDEMVISQLNACSDLLPRIDGRFDEKLRGVLDRLDWLPRPESVIEAHCDFILNLVRTHPSFANSAVVGMLRRFITSEFGRRMEPASEGKPAKIPNERLKTGSSLAFMNKQAHKVLREIVNMYPSMLHELPQKVKQNCPHYLTTHPHALAQYFRNALALARRYVEIRGEILEVVLRRMILIDAFVVREEIEETAQLAKRRRSESAERAECDQPSEDADAVEDPTHVCLDLSMRLLFDFIDTLCKTSKEDDEEAQMKQLRSAYRTVLGAFERVVFPSYKCTHLPFIMFYFCAKHKSLYEDFISWLWQHVQDPNQISVLREMSACYLSSLLARAEYISLDTVRVSLALWSRWLQDYTNRGQDAQLLRELSTHHTYFAVCQAMLYLIAFRQSDLTQTETDLQFLRGLRIERIVSGPLNPLRFCLEHVVSNFISIARRHKIAYCDTILDRNARQSLYCSPAERKANEIESYFPFDPYMLDKSSSRVRPLYRVYHGLEADEDSDMSDEEEEAPGESRDVSADEAETRVKGMEQTVLSTQEAGLSQQPEVEQTRVDEVEPCQTRVEEPKSTTVVEEVVTEVAATDGGEVRKGVKRKHESDEESSEEEDLEDDGSANNSFAYIWSRKRRRRRSNSSGYKDFMEYASSAGFKQETT